jgi:hypothetical protein
MLLEGSDGAIAPTKSTGLLTNVTNPLLCPGQSGERNFSCRTVPINGGATVLVVQRFTFPHRIDAKLRSEDEPGRGTTSQVIVSFNS